MVKEAVANFPEKPQDGGFALRGGGQGLQGQGGQGSNEAPAAGAGREAGRQGGTPGLAWRSRLRQHFVGMPVARGLILRPPSTYRSAEALQAQADMGPGREAVTGEGEARPAGGRGLPSFLALASSGLVPQAALPSRPAPPAQVAA